MIGAVVRAVRDNISRRFLRRIKRATHRAAPQIATIATARVLVVAPHMDDEVIPCGGALLLHRRQGSTIRVVFATDGSAGVSDAAIANTLKRVRSAEARAVRDYVGFDDLVELGFPDGQLARHEDALANSLSEQIRSFRPSIIFCPFPTDGHGDHMATAWAVGAATRLAQWRGEIFAFEVWTTLWPNVLVDITSVAEQKERAIRLYESQMADRDYASAILGLNRYRGLGRGLAFAEAYYACSGSEFARLVADLDRI